MSAKRKLDQKGKEKSVRKNNKPKAKKLKKEGKSSTSAHGKTKSTEKKKKSKQLSVTPFKSQTDFQGKGVPLASYTFTSEVAHDVVKPFPKTKIPLKMLLLWNGDIVICERLLESSVQMKAFLPRNCFLRSTSPKKTMAFEVLDITLLAEWLKRTKNQNSYLNLTFLEEKQKATNKNPTPTSVYLLNIVSETKGKEAGSKGAKAGVTSSPTTLSFRLNKVEPEELEILHDDPKFAFSCYVQSSDFRNQLKNATNVCKNENVEFLMKSGNRILVAKGSDPNCSWQIMFRDVGMHILPEICETTNETSSDNPFDEKPKQGRTIKEPTESAKTMHSGKVLETVLKSCSGNLMEISLPSQCQSQECNLIRFRHLLVTKNMGFLPQGGGTSTQVKKEKETKEVLDKEKKDGEGSENKEVKSQRKVKTHRLGETEEITKEKFEKMMQSCGVLDFYAASLVVLAEEQEATARDEENENENENENGNENENENET